MSKEVVCTSWQLSILDKIIPLNINLSKNFKNPTFDHSNCIDLLKKGVRSHSAPPYGGGRGPFLARKKIKQSDALTSMKIPNQPRDQILGTRICLSFCFFFVIVGQFLSLFIFACLNMEKPPNEFREHAQLPMRLRRIRSS